MERINPLQLRRPDEIEETIEVSDPSLPDVCLSVILRARADTVFRMGISHRTREYIQRYITGDQKFMESKGESGEPPALLMAPDPTTGDSVPVPVTEPLCSVIAYLSCMEEAAWRHRTGNKDIPVTGQDKPYSFLEWAVLAERMGGAFDALAIKADHLMNRAEGRLGNTERAAG